MVNPHLLQKLASGALPEPTVVSPLEKALRRIESYGRAQEGTPVAAPIGHNSIPMEVSSDPVQDMLTLESMFGTPGTPPAHAVSPDRLSMQEISGTDPQLPPSRFSSREELRDFVSQTNKGQVDDVEALKDSLIRANSVVGERQSNVDNIGMQRTKAFDPAQDDLFQGQRTDDFLFDESVTDPKASSVREGVGHKPSGVESYISEPIEGEGFLARAQAQTSTPSNPKIRKPNQNVEFGMRASMSNYDTIRSTLRSMFERSNRGSLDELNPQALSDITNQHINFNNNTMKPWLESLIKDGRWQQRTPSFNEELGLFIQTQAIRGKLNQGTFRIGNKAVTTETPPLYLDAIAHNLEMKGAPQLARGVYRKEGPSVYTNLAREVSDHENINIDAGEIRSEFGRRDTGAGEFSQIDELLELDEIGDSVSDAARPSRVNRGVGDDINLEGELTGGSYDPTRGVQSREVVGDALLFDDAQQALVNIREQIDILKDAQGPNIDITLESLREMEELLAAALNSRSVPTTGTINELKSILAEPLVQAMLR